MLKITPTNHKWWILAAMISSLSLVFLDQSAVIVALPQMQLDLHLSNTLQQWVINMYLLTLAALIIFGGRAGDNYGHRRLFLIGITIFSLSSLTCALAQSGWQIILSRCCQGIGGALMIPVASVIVTHGFSERERGRAIGLYVGIASIFLSLGPLVGGLITEYLNWRWIFFLNLPIAIFGFVMAIIVVPKLEPERTDKTIDWLGAIALLITLFSLVIALMEASHWGWTSHIILGLFILSGLAAWFFWRHEKTFPAPLVDLSIFKNVTFIHCALALALTQAMFVAFIFWALYLQNILHFAPAVAGLLTIPVTLPVTFMAPMGGHLRDRFGPQIVIRIGIIIAMSAMLWVSVAAWFHNYWCLLPAFLLFGCATPMVISSCMATAIPSVGLAKRGVGSGVINALRQIGSTLGLAIITSIISTTYHWRLENLLQKNSLAIPQQSINKILTAAKSFAQLHTLLNSLPHSQQIIMMQLNQHAYITGFSLAMFIMAFSGLAALWMTRKIPAALISK